jgi:hypothetical protein
MLTYGSRMLTYAAALEAALQVLHALTEQQVLLRELLRAGLVRTALIEP